MIFPKSNTLPDDVTNVINYKTNFMVILHSGQRYLSTDYPRNIIKSISYVCMNTRNTSFPEAACTDLNHVSPEHNADLTSVTNLQKTVTKRPIHTSFDNAASITEVSWRRYRGVVHVHHAKFQPPVISGLPW